jgi:ankyrin repeat protein
MDVKTAIQTGDAAALRALLAEDPARANQLIEWGRNGEIHTHPLHYVCDMLFGGTLKRGQEMPLIEALLTSGADCNHQASNGETPLMGAASLDAEDVGLRLLDAGAHPDQPVARNTTPLHWAAALGLVRLVARLIEMGADVTRKDAEHHSGPVGWALYGRFNLRPGSAANHARVIAVLVAAGAEVAPEWLADEQVQSDPSILAALRAGASEARMREAASE